ncbi:uncharacterized protein LOC125498622 [Beta vulgaris subsp. vulgaris]|uniref:uncharacterized protein LOC125498622 n=1 Tax=Beta vulgaris subsp. vulgaris TaxID=3555 RepID=UPI00203701F5|nr:uncharacterized protein LOC125498622 [Beta vulgaris subsp. vulgaris]
MWVFDRRRIEMMEVVNKAVRGAVEFEKANDLERGRLRELTSPDKWSPPSTGMFKLNSDAAIFKNQQVGLGGIVRDCEGDVLLATCLRIEGSKDAEVAEALSTRHCLQVAVDAGLRNLIVEVDCLKLFNHLSNRKFDPSSFGIIVQDILCIASHCSSISFSHVRRKGNCVAHNLAQLSSSMDGLRVWIEEVPTEVLSSVMADIQVI